MKVGDAAQLVSICLACMKPWVQSLAPHKTKVVAHVCNPKPGVVKTSKSKVLWSHAPQCFGGQPET